MPLPDRILDLATAQLGLLGRHQVAALVGPKAADNALGGERFRRIDRGVYLVRGSASHPCQAAVAATLRAREPAVLTGPAALRLLELEAIALGDRGAVAVPVGRRLRGLGVPVVRDRDPGRPTWQLGQIRVASPADALLESCLLDPPPSSRSLRLTHDRLRWTGRLRPGMLQDRRRQLRLPDDGRPMRELTELDGERAVGDGERGLGAVLRRFDPAPEPQIWITPHRCVDWYFRSLLLGIEYQGDADHGGPTGRQRDRARQDELAAVGVRLLYVTSAELNDEPSLLARVAAALTVRANELGSTTPRLCPAA